MADILDRFRKKPKKIIRSRRDQFLEKSQVIPGKPVHQVPQQSQQAQAEQPQQAQVQRTQPQKPQQVPPAPAIQKPQAPNPPVAPKAPRGKIEMERKVMGLYYSRRARILYYFLGFVLLAAGGYVMLFMPMELGILYAFVPIQYVSGTLAFLGIVIALYAEAKRRSAYYYITQYRIVESWGLVRKSEHAIQLEQVESVRIRQGFLERILGIGDVEVKTGRDALTLHKVGNPGRAESLILSELNRKRAR